DPGQDLLRRRRVVHAGDRLRAREPHPPRRELPRVHLTGIRRQGRRRHRRATELETAARETGGGTMTRSTATTAPVPLEPDSAQSAGHELSADDRKGRAIRWYRTR